uniref:Uncharacterized protein n=1 Tax=viral metagenome TaxID=1070528 RepID=A0A6C0JH80_9ZZZZ
MSYNINGVPIVANVGTLALYNGVTDPNGWLLCDGNPRDNTNNIYGKLINAGIVNQNSYTTAMSLHIDNTTNNIGAGWSLIGLSGDGNTMVLNGKYLTTNACLSYSILFTPYNTIPTAFACTTCSISDNGKTIIMNGYQSTNQGATWITNLCSKFSAISSDGKTILMDSGTSTYLLLSTDGGTTYNQISGLSTGTNNLPTTVTATIYGVCMSSNASVMAATFGATYQLYLSVNSGNTWSVVSTLTSSFFLTMSGNGQALAYRNGSTIYFSTNQGNSWPAGGTISGVFGSNNQITISSDGTKAFSSFNYFYYTGTGNWSVYKLGSNNGYSDQAFNYTYFGCAATPSFSVIYGSSGQYGGNLVLSYNLAKNWYFTGFYNQYYLPSAFNWGGINGISMSSNGNTILVSNYYTPNNINTGSWKSTDGGNTFSRLRVPQIYQYQIQGGNGVSGNEQVIFVKQYLSTDAGTTYVDTARPANALVVLSYTGSVIYADGNTSTDMGKTWNSYTNYPAVAMSDDATTMIGGNTVLYLSNNYGKNWTPISGSSSVNSGNGLPTSNFSGNVRVAISSNGTVMAFGVVGSTGSLYVSVNSGTSWTNLSGMSGLPIPINKYWIAVSVSGDGTKIFACTNGISYLSTDTAATFTTINTNTPLYSGLPQACTAAYMCRNGNNFVMCTSGTSGVYKSNNGLLWWTLQNSSYAGSADFAGAPVILNSGFKNWQTYSISGNGNYALAGTNGSVLYVSNDSEKSFLPMNANGNLQNAKNWKGTAISSTGQYMLAVASADNVYYSNFYGIYWYQLSGISGGVNQYYSTTGLPTTTSSWNVCAMDGTGTFMLAGINSGSLYLSTNSGTNWLTISGAANSFGLPTGASAWSTCAISKNASYMLAGINSGSLYLSSNSGTNWLTISGAANSLGLPTVASAWSTVSINSTGTSMIAGINSGSLFLSTNSGNNWSTISGISNTLGLPTTASAWTCSAINDSGLIIYVGINLGLLYYSVDGGKVWTNTGPFLATSGKWQTIAMNGSGTSIAAAEFGGYVYNITSSLQTNKYTPFNLNTVTSTDLTTLRYIIKY